jgi:hypothetical protein
VRMVVGKAAKLLAGINQLPVTKPQELPRILVGLDNAVEQLTAGQQAAGQEPRMVVLTGMGGIGKTTLAKAVFNQLHDSDPTALCHFLQMEQGVLQGGAVKVSAGMGRLAAAAASAGGAIDDLLTAKQEELLNGLMCTSGARVSTAADGRRQLLDWLGGRRVLLVVDNVWGGQLEELLPGNIMGVLGAGSVVLVTSRQSGAMGKLTGAQWVVEEAVGLLSDQESRELLCWHAYGSSSPPDGDTKLIERLAARCGGLPRAVELVGRHCAGAGGREGFRVRMEEAVAFAYSMECAGRLDRQGTVFEELQLSWDALEAGERDSLQDIVWFLRGQPWELVGSYCGEGVLERLRSLAFVTRGRGGGADEAAVDVHNVIVDFCKMGLRGRCQELHRQLRACRQGYGSFRRELSVRVRQNVFHCTHYQRRSLRLCVSCAGRWRVWAEGARVGAGCRQQRCPGTAGVAEAALPVGVQLPFTAGADAGLATAAGAGAVGAGEPSVAVAPRVCRAASRPCERVLAPTGKCRLPLGWCCQTLLLAVF